MSLLRRQKKTSSAFTFKKMRTHVTMIFAWSDKTVYLYCDHSLFKKLLAYSWTFGYAYVLLLEGCGSPPGSPVHRRSVMVS